MKILIAYDGSECSDKALTDLRKAGLPAKAEAVILTVADSWAAQGSLLGMQELSVQHAMLLDNTPQISLKDARSTAEKAAEVLGWHFPGWKIRSESLANSATEGIIEKVEDWKPDLLVMGSHGRSQAGRILFGSVSHHVLTHVHCNLRISKGRAEEEKEIPPARVVVAYDGSQESEAALETALCRHWPKGTAIRLITVIDTRVSLAFLRPTGPIRYWTDAEDKDPVAWVDRMLDFQKRRIEEKKLIAYTEAVKGEPKRTLLKEAEAWGADVIFAGCRGLTGKEKLVTGSVSTALVLHAHCSVEVVHRLAGASDCCQKALQEHRDCMSNRENWSY